MGGGSSSSLVLIGADGSTFIHEGAKEVGAILTGEQTLTLVEGLSEIGAGLMQFASNRKSSGGGSGGSSGRSGRSLKKISGNKQANEIAKKCGYEGAEDLKEAFLGNQGAKFNMMIDTTTGEIVLVSITDSGNIIHTELFYRR